MVELETENRADKMTSQASCSAPWLQRSAAQTKQTASRLELFLEAAELLLHSMLLCRPSTGHTDTPRHRQRAQDKWQTR